jgi:hypothetical protein
LLCQKLGAEAMSAEGMQLAAQGAELQSKMDHINESMLTNDERIAGWKTREMVWHDMGKNVLAAQVELLGTAGDLLGSKLHDAWRDENFRNEDGTYRPRIKSLVQRGESQKWVNQDQVIADDNLLFEQDIASTTFEELHPHWQSDNKQAADFVIGLLVDNGGIIDLEDAEQRIRVGSAVHNEWLSRSSWVEPGLEVPFVDLSAEQQAKDLQQIVLANEIFFAE